MSKQFVIFESAHGQVAIRPEAIEAVAPSVERPGEYVAIVTRSDRFIVPGTVEDVLAEISGKRRRGASTVANAIQIAKAATREKDSSAVTIGSKGGKARAEKLSPKTRSDIARAAATARWGRKASPK